MLQKILSSGYAGRTKWRRFHVILHYVKFSVSVYEGWRRAFIRRTLNFLPVQSGCAPVLVKT